MMKLQGLKITALCGIIATLATSCGNYMGGRSGFRVTTSGVHYGATADLDSLTGTGTTTQGNYTCPNSPNVLSNSDSSYYSSAGKYVVCTSPSTAYSILIHGNSMGSSAICVFPIQVIDSSHVYFKPDTSGLPMSACANINSANGIELSFPATNFNAVFIVDDNAKYQMQSCLANANAGGCPAYSYGKIR